MDNTNQSSIPNLNIELTLKLISLDFMYLETLLSHDFVIHRKRINNNENSRVSNIKGMISDPLAIKLYDSNPVSLNLALIGFP